MEPLIYGIIVVLLLNCILLIAILTHLLKPNHHLEDKLDDSEQAILLKTQETSTTLSNLIQQMNTLYSEIHLLSKGNYHQTQTVQDIQKRMESMQNILTDKKSRGNWGEHQLETLLESYFGQSTRFYQRQYHFKNNTACDIALFVPNDTRVLAIDSKFPLENFLKARDEHQLTSFQNDVKKHIRDISSKYINDETMDVAIMYIPSESIYTYIVGKCEDLVHFSYHQHVLMAGPTSLAGIVYTLIDATKAFERSQNLEAIEKSILNLKADMTRLLERSDKAYDYAAKSLEQLDLMKKSISKLSKEMDRIEQGHLND